MIFSREMWPLCKHHDRRVNGLLRLISKWKSAYSNNSNIYGKFTELDGVTNYNRRGNSRGSNETIRDQELVWENGSLKKQIVEITSFQCLQCVRKKTEQYLKKQHYHFLFFIQCLTRIYIIDIKIINFLWLFTFSKVNNLWMYKSS